MQKNKMVALLLAGLCASSVLLSSSCSLLAKSTLLATPAAAEEFSRRDQLKDTEFLAFKEKYEDFAASFSEATYEAFQNGKNFVVSPLSVYMALALVAECSAGETREEVLSAMNVTYEELQTNIPKLYRALSVEYMDTTLEYENSAYQVKEVISGGLDLSNSVWVNEGTEVKQDCLTSLSENYYCYAYAADFLNDNLAANQAIRKFINDQTRGLIKKDFQFSKDTLFTLINTIYLKDFWSDQGKDAEMTDVKYNFTNSNGSIVSKYLMIHDYYSGRAYEEEDFSYFYTKTVHGHNLKFILPKEGYEIADVFTAENISTVNSVTNFNSVNEENLIYYYTRCLFPEYEASFDNDVADVLRDKFAISSLFDLPRCDLSALTDEPAFCDRIVHATQLKVTKKGIEGAAVTLLPNEGASGPSQYTRVYENFVVDKAFGFILTDWDDTPIFTGVIEKI